MKKLSLLRFINCLAFGVVALAMFATVERAVAIERSWTDPAGGYFDDGDNWNTGVPETADSAYFSIAGDYTVNFSVDTEILAVRLSGTGGASTVTFDLNGHTLTTTSTSTTSETAGIVVRSNNDSNLKVLRLLNGSVVVNSLRVGQIGGVLATLEVSSGAELVVNAGGNVRVGNNSTTGLLNIVNGGVLKAGATFEVGRQEATGILRVEGAGSLINMNPNGARQNIRLGSTEADSHGQLIVLDGGKVQGISSLDIARTGSTTGWTLADGTGSQISALNIYVGGRSGASGGVGTLEVRNNASVSASTELRVYGQGEIEIYGGSITAGTSTWSTGSGLHLILRSDTDTPLAVSGALTLNSGVGLELSLGDDFSGQEGDTFTVLSYGTLAGTFQDLDEGDLILVKNIYFQLSYGAKSSADQVTLTVMTVIPETKTAAAAVAGVLLCLLVGHRIRRRNVG